MIKYNQIVKYMNNFRTLIPLLFFTLIVSLNTVHAAADRIKAPEWDVSEWINGTGTTLEALKGKVVIIDFFQLWCPGCNNFSIPLVETWEKTFVQAVKDEKLVFISIHTVFEGHDYQNPTRLKNYLKEKGISHLVGVDRHKEGEELPETMKIYRTRGTPEMAIIDKKGMIRFKKFGGFETVQAEHLIRKLLAE